MSTGMRVLAAIFLLLCSESCLCAPAGRLEKKTYSSSADVYDTEGRLWDKVVVTERYRNDGPVLVDYSRGPLKVKYLEPISNSTCDATMGRLR